MRAVRIVALEINGWNTALALIIQNQSRQKETAREKVEAEEVENPEDFVLAAPFSQVPICGRTDKIKAKNATSNPCVTVNRVSASSFSFAAIL